jgi:hypothetical protein
MTKLVPGRWCVRWYAAPIPEIPAPTMSTSKLSVFWVCWVTSSIRGFMLTQRDEKLQPSTFLDKGAEYSSDRKAEQLHDLRNATGLSGRIGPTFVTRLNEFNQRHRDYSPEIITEI